MALWIITLTLIGLSLRLFQDDLLLLWGNLGGGSDFAGVRGFAATRRDLESVQREVRGFEDRLASGTLPNDREWKSLRRLPAPWGVLIHDTASELRSAGCRILPTLKRLRELSAHQLTALLEGRARSTQSLAQAGVCAALVPLMSLSLYFLIPALSEHRLLWGMTGFIALFWAAIGAAWMAHQADQARWGGLMGVERAWALWAPATIERLLARVESGSPPDLAWTQAIQFLREGDDSATALAEFWRSAESRGSTPHSARGAIARLGREVQSAVQTSLFEGLGCRERVDAALITYKEETRSSTERELSLLATRTLKPLFFCVAPAALAQLGIALALAATSQ